MPVLSMRRRTAELDAEADWEASTVDPVDAPFAVREYLYTLDKRGL